MTDQKPFPFLTDEPGPLGGQETDQSIPLPNPDEEAKISASEVPEQLPILALRNTVLFPGVVLPITLGRDSSLQLIKDASDADRLIGVVAQRSAQQESPTPEDLYDIGTVAEILKLIKMPDGSRSIIIQGKRRIRITEYVETEPYFRARVEPVVEPEPDENLEMEAHTRSIKELAVQIVREAPHLPSEAAEAIENIESADFLIHFIASNLQEEVKGKQEILATIPLMERAELVLQKLQEELQVMELSEQIRSRVRSDVDEQQREYLLRQQLKAIQEELGETDERAEIEDLRHKAAEKDLPPHAREQVDKELTRLARTNPASPDYAVTRNYVDWILDLPWDRYSQDRLDVTRAETVLNEDHYGLDDVKERILEHLAVLKLKGDMKAPILCLHGPPGVGKTSLGQSIARAMEREFVRMSLGGVRDEAEIRGHRRTYVGALPGRILQGLKKAGTNNPVFMLDEVDKLDSGMRGDPASALLEVLDPEQNDSFNDHYLELDYDLSKVFFIATANYAERIPPPLRDRMEMIEITGYTQEEKLQIARGYLLPRQLERNGLADQNITLSDDALRLLIDGYTRESGVRQLERTIGAVLRGVAKEFATDTLSDTTVDAQDIEDYLGVRKFESDVAERTEVPGVATGLAWTPAGGEILFIEASLSRGSGRMTVTGQLGDVMKESAQAAVSYVKAQADELGIPQDAFRYWDLHLHVPAGATPKDGPSAGVAMLSALVSAYTQRRVRHTLAMTGEITLRGLVLPVGGIKEKVLAARRAGIETVLLPQKNAKDVNEIQEGALEGIKITYVERMDDVIDLVLEEEVLHPPAEYFAIPDEEKRHTGNRNGTVGIDSPQN
ncbi:endopeptidase La [Salinibacter sp. 10B]|uniref:endopeptidase La n=1 Tax=Salinibacter sp. 10B TaxID=1923971 RepID=UPI000CF51A51|nr:endopeptidase La [Salinibacter sp. 10B]PQJ36175.1 endopeptidase La [Salinibacter sp. 10B]